MDDDVSQTANASQAVRLIQVSHYGSGALVTPEGALFGVADERKNAVVAEQTGQDTARDITATDDQ